MAIIEIGPIDMAEVLRNQQGPLKVCRECGSEKPWSDFHVESRTARPRARCKPCMIAYNRKHVDLARRRQHDKQRGSGAARQSPASRRGTALRRYRITQAEYEQRFEAQAGLCAICHQPETIEVRRRNPWTLAIDHDHVGGGVRGLLCNRCNLLLGKVHDDPAILLAAVAYLTKGA